MTVVRTETSGLINAFRSFINNNSYVVRSWLGFGLLVLEWGEIHCSEKENSERILDEEVLD
jgi:hypothetical protein